MLAFFFSSRRRHTRWPRDWSSDVCSSDLIEPDHLSMAVVDHETPFGLSPFRIVLMATVAGLCGLAVIPFLSILLHPPRRSQALQLPCHLSGAIPDINESGVPAPLEDLLRYVT